MNDELKELKRETDESMAKLGAAIGELIIALVSGFLVVACAYWAYNLFIREIFPSLPHVGYWLMYAMAILTKQIIRLFKKGA